MTVRILLNDRVNNCWMYRDMPTMQAAQAAIAAHLGRNTPGQFAYFTASIVSGV